MGFLKKYDTESEVESWSATGGRDLSPIPDGTRVLAFVEKAHAKIWENSDEEQVDVQWRIVAPEQYAGRVLFDDLKVFSDRDWLRTRSVEAMIFIDRLMDGDVIEYLRADEKATPTDDDCPLHSWQGAGVAQLTLGLWKSKGGTSRNSVKSMSPPQDAAAATQLLEDYLAVHGGPIVDAFDDAFDDLDEEEVPF